MYGEFDDDASSASVLWEQAGDSLVEGDETRFFVDCLAQEISIGKLAMAPERFLQQCDALGYAQLGGPELVRGVFKISFENGDRICNAERVGRE